MMTLDLLMVTLCLMIDDGEDSVYLQSFGRRLSALRIQRGLSQEQLAAAAGLQLVEVRRAERGQHDLSVVALADLAQALSVQPADLMP